MRLHEMQEQNEAFGRIICGLLELVGNPVTLSTDKLDKAPGFVMDYDAQTKTITLTLTMDDPALRIIHNSTKDPKNYGN